MAYRQDDEPRRCEICLEMIDQNQLMLDLFRKESAQENSEQKLVWVHESCSKSAIEKWLKKKWARNS